MEDTNLPYHRKYRPNSLSEYIGNDKLKKSVLSILSRSKLRPQTILLYGDSGCGKTTMARIIAKEYNCENRDPNTGACGTCPSCQMMDEYIRTGDTSMLGNVKEVDIGAKSGKGDIDSVLEDVYLPTYGDEWKIYIFDEVQRASEALQNRLLKITEEPPEQVLFVFCTTNPEKLLDTLKNRCQIKGHVTKPTMQELLKLLRTVCKYEGVEQDKAGLEMIINRSEFTIRTALQNLAQVVSEQGSATLSSVTTVFESVSMQQVVNFYRSLLRKDVFRYVTLISEIKTKMDLKVFLEELRSFVIRGVYVINGLPVDGVTAKEIPVYKDLFDNIGIEKMGILLHRLLTMNTDNLELDLLMLGYMGVNTTTTSSASVDIPLPSIENETAKEEQNALHVVEEKEKESDEQGIANASKLMGSVGLDAILELGGTLVK